MIRSCRASQIQALNIVNVTLGIFLEIWYLILDVFCVVLSVIVVVVMVKSQSEEYKKMLLFGQE